MNADPRDYVLDLQGAAKPTDGGTNAAAGGAAGATAGRVPYLSIHFRCCGVYSPIYRNAAGTAYAGHCPRCRRAARVGISPDGDPGRVFTAG